MASFFRVQWSPNYGMFNLQPWTCWNREIGQILCLGSFRKKTEDFEDILLVVSGFNNVTDSLFDIIQTPRSRKINKVFTSLGCPLHTPREVPIRQCNAAEHKNQHKVRIPLGTRRCWAIRVFSCSTKGRYLSKHCWTSHHKAQSDINERSNLSSAQPVLLDIYDDETDGEILVFANGTTLFCEIRYQEHASDANLCSSFESCQWTFCTLVNVVLLIWFVI